MLSKGIFYAEISSFFIEKKSKVKHFLVFYYYRFIFIPIGLSKGLKANKKPLIAIPLLEEGFNKNPNGFLLNKKEIQGIAKQLDWSERQVERWIRRRKQYTKHSGFVF